MPIFVRMEDQLVLKAGDYAGISEFRSKPRSQNREEVLRFSGKKPKTLSRN